MAAKVEFDTSLSMAKLAGTIDGCEARVRAAVPIAEFVYLEFVAQEADAAGPDGNLP